MAVVSPSTISSRSAVASINAMPIKSVFSRNGKPIKLGLNVTPPRSGGSLLDLRSALPGLGRVEGKIETLGKKPSCLNGGSVRTICEHGSQRSIRVSCKSWACRPCAQVKAGKIAWLIKHGLSVLENCVLMTLTWNVADTRTHDVEYVRRTLSRVWEELRRRYPTSQYLYVKESTKRGQLHIHAVVSGWTGETWENLSGSLKKQSWLSVMWRKITGRVKSERPHPGVESFVVDVRRVRKPKGVPSYLVKYLTKGVHRTTPEFGYRYQTSRNWPRPATKEVDAVNLGKGTREVGWKYVNSTETFKNPVAVCTHSDTGCARCEVKVWLWPAGKVDVHGELYIGARFARVDHHGHISRTVNANARSTRARVLASLGGSRFGSHN